MADTRPRRVSVACVDAATLAAFVDGVLDPASRGRVVAHLASCVDCAALVGEVVRTIDELPSDEVVHDLTADPAVADRERSGHGWWMRPRGLAAVGGVVAIAATLLLVVLNRGSALDPLVAAIGDERLILARPTGGFHYGPLRSPVRGFDNTSNLQLTVEAARLRERAAQTYDGADLHASGVAELLTGKTTVAIESLQAAARLRADDATVIADLGAAHMTRFINEENQNDATAALDAFEKALALSPSLEEAWFNKALLLERMNRSAEALTAWTKYLDLPDEHGWRGEALRNRDALQRRLR